MLPIIQTPSYNKSTTVEMGDVPPSSTDAQSTEYNAWLSTSASAMLLPEKATQARKWFAERGQGMRSWREFASSNKFRLPGNPVVAGQRLVKNVEHFQTNYAVIFAVLFVYCILTSPLLLLALAACGGLMYVIRARAAQGRLVVAGHTLSPTYQYALVVVLSFPLFYMAGAGSIIFWVIGTLFDRSMRAPRQLAGASIVCIVAHAIFYASEPVPGEEFEHEIETI